jgi:hypothetical protein
MDAEAHLAENDGIDDEIRFVSPKPVNDVWS